VGKKGAQSNVATVVMYAWIMRPPWPDDAAKTVVTPKQNFAQLTMNNHPPRLSKFYLNSMKLS
jgi:hypothetical protein